jgi:FKBP-type peptidyl-prolyl cis-trans isomerase FkpA
MTSESSCRRMVAVAMLTLSLVSGCSTVDPVVTGARNEDSDQTPDAFLARNSQKAGVVVTASGLQYEVIKNGSGMQPTSRDVVHVLYSGHLLGSTTIIDTNRNAGVPDRPQLDTVIKGWEEGLQLMSEGSIYRFYIPPSLAYGEKGSGAIGPNKLLIYTIELIKVERSGRDR